MLIQNITGEQSYEALNSDATQGLNVKSAVCTSLQCLGAERMEQYQKQKPSLVFCLTNLFLKHILNYCFYDSMIKSLQIPSAKPAKQQCLSSNRIERLLLYNSNWTYSLPFYDVQYHGRFICLEQRIALYDFTIKPLQAEKLNWNSYLEFDVTKMPISMSKGHNSVFRYEYDRFSFIKLLYCFEL